MGKTDPAYMRKWRKDNPEKDKAIKKRYRDKVRRETLIAYSADPPYCACCDVNELAFLTLDHIADNGAEERREQGHRGGIQQYLNLRREGYPPGYQVLCWNCNCASGLYGECPHVSAQPQIL